MLCVKLPYELPKSEILEKSQKYMEEKLSAQCPIRKKDFSNNNKKFNNGRYRHCTKNEVFH